MDLTPEQFAEELPKWYHRWRKHNVAYSPLEERLTKKARTLGHLEIADLVDITHVLSNPHNIRGRVKKANTEDEIREKTREAIRCLSDPVSAFENMSSIRQWGLAYASKTLRCICPRNYAALDSKLHKGIGRRYFPSRNEVERYCQFLDFCERIRQMVSVPGPRENGAWFLADIEIALFQFVWDGGKIV
jgi:hypothetical protein